MPLTEVENSTKRIEGSFAVDVLPKGDLMLTMESEVTGEVSQKIPRMLVRQIIARNPQAAAILFGK
jgi:hypothetical protein